MRALYPLSSPLQRGTRNSMLQKLILKIEKLNSEGAGVGRQDGKVCFVPWTAPGDTVLAHVEKEGKDFNECRLLEIIEKSPDRVDPPCPYFLNCGGCQLQHISYEAQLKAKQTLVTDALKRIARLPDAAVSPIIPSPKIWNYRNRIRLHRDRKGKIGFFKNASHEIIEIEKCLIADERINEKLPLLRVVGAGSKPPLTDEVRVDGLRTFAQVNDPQNETMIKLVVDFADPKPGEKIIDLYCGVGNFTFPLARKGGEVIGIEKNGAEIEEARKRVGLEKVTNIRWIQQSAPEALVGLQGDGLRCDTLVADPPRRGLSEAVEGMMALKPKKIVYVSCNPATFARDAARLIKAGYHLEKCQPLDMFPHTSHVEVIGLLYI